MKIKSILIVSFILFSCSTAASITEISKLCEKSSDLEWKYWMYLYRDDPKIIAKKNLVDSICMDLKLNRISLEEAHQKLEKPFLIVASTLIKYNQMSLPMKFWHYSNYTASRWVGVKSAPFWVAWWLGCFFLFFLFFLSQVWELMEAPFAIMLAIHSGAFVLLLVGGFIPFLNMLSLIFGIIASMVGIIAGIKSILTTKS